MKTIQEMLQELSQCIVTVSGEFRFRTNWNGGKVPQPEPEKPDLDVFNPNVPFCIENVGDVQASVQYNTKNTNIRISKDYKTWNDYTSGAEIELNPKDRVYIKSDYVYEYGSYPKFNFTNANGTRLRARGNIASLIYGTGDIYVNKYTSTKSEFYNSMFKDCKSLVQAPELPATTLAYDCYNSTFRGCTSLTRAPELPATTLAGNCYYNMFYGCTSLTRAPELPATTLAENCYRQMFWDCASLAKAPELPATTLAENCYNSMFYHCTSLTRAPELPATALNPSCYSYMFEGCTSLTQAPELPATTLTMLCYNKMFSGCAKINYVKCLATDTSATDCTKNWLNNVSSTGTFECDNKKYFTLDSPDGIPTGWSITEINPDPPTPPEPEKPDLDTFDPNVPFCIENVGDVPASVQYNTKNTNIRISKDYKTWNDYTKGDSITLDPTERVYIKSDYVLDTGSSPRFVFNGDGARLRARGNIASLIYGTNDVYVNKYTSTEEYCYNSMFDNCVSLIQAPELPATTLANYCYRSMFNGCSSLTQAPELPATTLADYCYNQMFQWCTSLTQAPELPATTLAQNCYLYMFSGCASLTQAPELPATILTRSCYMFMFYSCTKLNYVKCLATNTSATDCTWYWLSGVSSTGDFYTPAATNWTTGIDGIPQGWTRHDINPDPPTPPEPEKPDLDTFDPNVPFCIENVGETPVEIGMYNYTEAVRTNCEISYDLQTWQNYNLPITQDANSTTISKITLTNKGDRVYIKADLVTNPGSFSNITVFNKSSAKKIRARGNIASLNKGTNDAYKTDYLTTDSYCYANLFSDCGLSLTQAPDLPATTLNENCYQSMFNGCTQLVNAPELPATKLAYMCYSNMFRGCVSLTQAPELPATTLANYCYYEMFSGCTSLTRAPELSATTLPIVCYSKMFKGCTKLNYVKCLATDISAANCTASWLEGVSSTGDFYAPVTTRWTTNSYSGIPSGWTRHNI